jgi:hypothetical protein
MMQRVLVPADNEQKDGIPRGACLLEIRGNRAICFFQRNTSFADLCQAASHNQGRLITIDFETVAVASYDDYNGELRPLNRGFADLEKWCGKPFYRNDLEAKDSLTSRRHQARRLMMQGRTAEAFRIDKRMGL